MEFERVEEINLTDFHKKHIERLFKACFEVYPENRIYFNQIPDFRFLVWEKPNLIGHVGISHRKIAAGDRSFSVFGIVDLCVHKDHWKKQVASGLIHEGERLGRTAGIDFMVLTTSMDTLYTKNGFKHVSNPCRWVLINNHRTYGVVERNIGDGFMVKEISDMPWPPGVIDLMGHMF